MEHSAPLFKRKKIMTKFLNESGFRRIIKTIKNAIGKKQDALESGVNIKTVNNNSLLGDGDLTIKGITSISTAETSESGGSNTVAIKTTDGQTTTFNVKNGKDGADGVSLGEIGLVQNTGEGTDVVMSQQAVSKEVHRISDEDLNGTSEWIKLRLAELGWEIGKKLNGNNELLDDATRCVTPLMELPTLDNHSYTFHYGTTGDTNSAWCFYYGDGVRLRAYQHEGYYDYEKTVTPNAQFNWRLTVGLDKIAECFIYDDTANDYLWRGDEYLKDICKKYLVDYEKLTGEISNIANEKERVNLFNPANVLEEHLLDTTYGKITAWDAATKGEYAAVAKIPVKKNHYYCIINPYFSNASGTPRVGVMLGNTDYGNSTKHNIVFSGGKYTVAKAAYTSDISIDTLTFQLYRTQNTVPYPIETPMVEVYEMHSIDEAISYINSRVGETREINDSVNIDNKILESNVGTLSSMMSDTSMLVFGDSITANHGWSNYIANKLKWKGISNIAIGGANISGAYNVTSGNQRNLIYQIRQAANLLGDVCYAEGTLNNNTYTKVYDIVFISMGFNDAKNGYACGSLDDVKDVEWSTLAPADDNTVFPTIAKAIKYCIFYLKNNVITGTVTVNGETKNVAVDCRKARFIWQTPIGTSTIYGTWTAEQTDARLRDVENVITSICNHYSIQVINGRLTSGITREEEGLVSGGKYLSDSIHPNGDGYIKIGEMNLGGILGNNANNLVPQLTQTTGDSEESVMSQKAVTDELIFPDIIITESDFDNWEENYYFTETGRQSSSTYACNEKFVDIRNYDKISFNGQNIGYFRIVLYNEKGEWLSFLYPSSGATYTRSVYPKMAYFRIYTTKTAYQSATFTFTLSEGHSTREDVADVKRSDIQVLHTAFQCNQDKTVKVYEGARMTNKTIVIFANAFNSYLDLTTGTININYSDGWCNLYKNDSIHDTLCRFSQNRGQTKQSISMILTFDNTGNMKVYLNGILKASCTYDNLPDDGWNLYLGRQIMSHFSIINCALDNYLKVIEKNGWMDWLPSLAWTQKAQTINASISKGGWIGSGYRAQSLVHANIELTNNTSSSASYSAMNMIKYPSGNVDVEPGTTENVECLIEMLQQRSFGLFGSYNQANLSASATGEYVVFEWGMDYRYCRNGGHYNLAGLKWEDVPPLGLLNQEMVKKVCEPEHTYSNIGSAVGQISVDSNGNLHMFNGSVWKQINNS